MLGNTRLRGCTLRLSVSHLDCPLGPYFTPTWSTQGSTTTPEGLSAAGPRRSEKGPARAVASSTQQPAGRLMRRGPPCMHCMQGGAS